MTNQHPEPFLKFPWLTPVLLFMLALLPRLPDLGRFLTADEFLWVDRSRNFLAGLTNAAWQCTTVVEKWEFAEGLACTLRTGHPGVTTMWTGSFGFVLRWLADGRPTSLHKYVAEVATNPLDATFIAPERLGTVLITSLWVVAVYWLARRLFGRPIALVSALLIALDPFHIGLSRVIHHDALSTTFMTLAALTALIYWGQQPGPGRRWLILSGVLGGFGFISKSPAMYLMPFIALTGLWFLIADRRRGPATALWPQLGQTVLDGLLWFAVAGTVVFAVWPAMWVIPRETIETVFFIGSKYATGGHAKGNFFLGDVSQDPGALFYPVTWLYRTTPLILIGIIGAIINWTVQPSSQQKKTRSSFTIHHSSFQRYLPLMLLFIVGYYLLMTIGEKKQDRYFLPAYPWLTFIAAYGLISITRMLKFSNRLKTLAATILLVNGTLVALNFPYYFTYYNPLLGGIKSAANAVTIGWGEGLDLAADYLNQKNPATPPRVASWYESTFTPFYRGPSISYSKEKGKALAGDYAVFYINQTQRRYPDEILFDYFETHFAPEKVITLHGLDYAWIYPSLGVDHYVQDQTYTGIASLLAWQWVQGDDSLTTGQAVEFELWWEYLGKQPEERFFFRLVDAQGRVWAEGHSEPVATENTPADQWREGEIIMEQGALTLPPNMPPGQYQLHIGFDTQAAAVTAGELLFDLPPEESLIAVTSNSTATYALPTDAVKIEHPLTPALTLLGAHWPAEPVQPGDAIPLELYWRVEQSLPADTQIHAALMTPAGEAAQAWFNLTLSEIFNPAETTWQPGDRIHTRWQLILLPDTAPGDYKIDLIPADNLDATLSVGQAVIVGD